MKKKIVFISGSTKGIGLSIAHRMHEDNYHVIFNSRKKNNFEQIKKKYHNSNFFLGDVSDPNDVKKIYKNFKKKI